MCFLQRLSGSLGLEVGRFQTTQRLEQLLVAGPLLEVLVHADEANDPLTVDDQRGWVRDLTLLLVQDAVAPNGLGIWVYQIEIGQAERASQFLEFVRRIDADCPHLGPECVELLYSSLQLPELVAAVGSPDAAKEDQDDVLLAAEIGQPVRRTVRRLQG